MTDAGAGEAGFTLLEMVCVLAIVALLAAIMLPRVPFATSRPRLEGYVIEAASLLKADRTAAMRRHTEITARVDAATRSVRSGSTGRVLQLPDDVEFDAVLPARCNQHPALSTISFFASGMSCGGTIALSRLGTGFEIRVNWLTGGVEIAARNTP